MRDLVDALDERLTAIAVAPDDASAAARAAALAPPRRPWRRRALAGTTAVTGGTVIALLALTGTSTADFPIFDTPSTDATAVGRTLPLTGKHQVDLSAAHAFGTAAGPGYALRDKDEKTVCLLVPDGIAPGTYGSACADAASKVARDGLLLEVTDRASGAPLRRVTFLLPSNAEQPRVTAPDGVAVRAEVEHGILSAELPRGGEISWQIGDRRGRRMVAPSAAISGDAAFSCPDGHVVTTPVPAAGTTPEETRRALSAAQKQACAR